MKFRPFFLPWIKMSLFFFHARPSLVAFQSLLSLSLDVSIDDVFYLEQVSIQFSVLQFSLPYLYPSPSPTKAGSHCPLKGHLIPAASNLL